MDGDVEWLDDDSPAPPPAGSPARIDEVLEFGARRRRPRWLQRLDDRAPAFRTLRWITPVLALTLLAGYLVLGQPAARMRPHAAIPSPSAAADLLDSGVVFLARRPGPLADYVRPTAQKGACVVAPVGSGPIARISRRLSATLPGFDVRDVGRILDQSTALCGVQLRATDRTGTVLVVEVAAPRHRAGVDYTILNIRVSTIGGDTLCVASALTPAGWSVTVGSLGRPADQPSSALLLQLAQDPLLLW